MRSFSSGIIDILKAGGVGVMPTDTIYGIVGSALKKETVERIYRLRARDTKKPMIVLIGSIADLKHFGVKLDVKTKKLLREIWLPRKKSDLRSTSVILRLNANRSSLNAFSYLHRGKGGIAFRLPSKKTLRNLLKKTGPLVAPSANLEGLSPARTIREAKKYFGDRLDFYVDGGKIDGKPSRLIELKNNHMKILRS